MDKGYRQTSKLEKELVKSLKKEYSKARVELEDKARKALRKFEVEDAQKRAMMKTKQAGKAMLSKEDYMKWRQSKLAETKWLNSMAEECAQRMAVINGQSIETINRTGEKVYAINLNAGGAEVGISFTQIPEATITRLLRDETAILPPKMPKKLSYKGKKLKQHKDIRWNMKNVKSAVAQGIMQGESVPKIANRIGKTVVSQNRKAMMRTARTAITSAQNGARYDAYSEAARTGLKVEKRWVATQDSRTRKSHAAMDGEQVPLKEEFSNGLMFPADPEGDPAEVYNCRCTMVPEIIEG